MPKIDSTFNPDEYSPVAERIALFYEAYPNGQIHTRLVSYEDGRVIVEASVFRSETDVRPAATGLASEHESDGEINAVACLENTETSAVGRALANLGFTGSLRRPSREEMEKVERRVAERSASGYERLQNMANAHVGVAKLLRRARRAGFPAERAELLDCELRAAQGEESRLVPIASELRRWLRVYTGRCAETLEHLRVAEALPSQRTPGKPPGSMS